MAFYRTCPNCGSHLDPGEACDCIGARYVRLTPENQDKFEAMADSLLEEQGAYDCAVAQVCAEARAVFPERFTGRTDREIVNEIAEVVRRAEKEAPAGAANTDGDRAEQICQAVSASYDT